MKEQGTIILLDASPETILSRVSHSDKRPILNGHMNVEYISELMSRRKEHYENAADLTVTTDGKSIDEVTEEILELLFPAED
jgi:shikimate kinase